jgi:hypothetical protein
VSHAPVGGRDCPAIYYAAPELCLENTVETQAIDVFGFGSILFEILTRKPVFPHSLYPFSILHRLLNGDMPPVPDECGKFMQLLISHCWLPDPMSRPSFDVILDEIKTANFQIVPGGNHDVIRNVVAGVLNWETQSALRSSE